MLREAVPREDARPRVSPESETRQAPPAGVPWRALIVGTLLLPLLTHFGHLSYIIAQSAVWTAQTLLRGPVMLLFLLACWRMAWRRVSPRLARYLCLSRSEMILVYLMATVGTALAGECWAIHVVPGLAGTAAYQAATAHPEWAAWLGDTPRWFFVQDPDMIRAIHYGRSSLYLPTNLRALAVPVAAWSVLMLSLALFTQCLAQLVRRQWIQRERLSFPLVYLPMTLVETEGPNAWWRSRLLWAGVAVAGSIELINGLNYLYPAVPYLPVKVTEIAAAPDRPWSGLGPIWVAFYPWVIALGFMVPQEVTFSLWFFFWMTRVQDMVVMMAGLRSEGGYAPGLPPYHIHQETGAFLVMGAMLLWRARHDLGGDTLLRPLRKVAGSRVPGKARNPARQRLPPGRRALLGLLASAGAVLIWAAAARIPLWLAGGFLAVYGLFSVVLGRLAAESGGPSSYPPLSTHETLALAGSLDHLAQPALVTFGWWQNLGGQVTDGLLPHQVTGARLAEDVGAGRWLHLALAVGAVAGVLTGIWSLLHLYFHFGIMSAEVRDWPARSAPLAAFQFIHEWLNEPTAVTGGKQLAFLAGGAVAGLLVWLRQSFVSWPLHPIGYAVAGNWGMQEVWCPFFVAWLLKVAALRGGGIRLYRALLPFFLGVLLGDLLIPMGWAVIGLLTDQQMYLSFPH
jgi:Family of unknown function (DUF6785)/Domain of unknown function (DUF6784)